MRKQMYFKGLLSHSNFRKLWAGSTISLFGSQVTFLAMPFTAALILHATAMQMGLLTMAETSPTLLGGLFIGVWVDRLRHRPLLIGADIGRALLLGSIPIADLVGVLHIEYLILVAFLVGTLTLVFNIAYTAFLPSLVASEQLVEANSKLEISSTLSQIAGPGIAGALIQAFTAPIAIIIDALSFLFSAGCLSVLHVQKVQRLSEERQSFWHDLVEGLRVVINNPSLLTIAACCATLNGFGGIKQALLVLYFTHILGWGAAFYGVLFAIASVSGLFGALFNAWILHHLGTGSTLLLSALGIGVGWLLIPVAGIHSALTAPLIILGALLFGISNTVFNVTGDSLVQRITPQHLLGRVNACMNVIGVGTLPLGALLGGFLGTLLGLRTALLIAGCGLSLGFVWIQLSPLRKIR
ncbi:MAG TPA: MFS transporter [Ktedonobacteraceae bacterium]